MIPYLTALWHTLTISPELIRVGWYVIALLIISAVITHFEMRER
jgi:hypothetical protein